MTENFNQILLQDFEQIYLSKIEWNRFRNSRILITGANGFLPAYMAEFFIFLNKKHKDLNLKIIGLGRNKEKLVNRFYSYLNEDSLELIIQDVAKKIKYDKNVDFIIHAASLASPKYFIKDPLGTIDANILGTRNLLEFAKEKKIKSFLFFSSGEIYGNLSKNDFIYENEYGYLNPLELRSCYSESKRMGENICIAFFKLFNLPIKIVRPFHTYGPGMSLSDGRVFADFVNSAVNSKKIIIESDGKALRSFCYLSDATAGFLKILIEGKSGEAYNLGNPDEEYSIYDLAKHIARISNSSVVLKNKIKYSQNFIMKANPSIEKLNDLGWFPKVGIEEGFKKTIKSYK